MRVLELFSGSGSVARAFREAGHETFTVDIEPDFKPDLIADILALKVSDLPPEFRNPDVVWASPPCTTFSVSSIDHYWKDGKPKNAACYIGLALALKAVELIKELRPRYFFIENPRGMLRQQNFMQAIPRKTVTYCQYGEQYQKPTDIWTNAAEWIPRKACGPGDNCHESQPRGYKAKVAFNAIGKGVQGLEGAFERGIIPPELCREIVAVCEGKAPIVQKILLT